MCSFVPTPRFPATDDEILEVAEFYNIPIAEAKYRLTMCSPDKRRSNLAKLDTVEHTRLLLKQANPDKDYDNRGFEETQRLMNEKGAGYTKHCLTLAFSVHKKPQ